MMGGTGAHEYMAPCAAGENDVALSDAGYAANVEIASATPQPVELPPALPGPEPVETPGTTTIEAVTRLLEVPAGALIKALPVLVEDRGPLLVLVRGDHSLNEIKLQNALGAPARPAEAQEVRDLFGTEPGFIGPIGAQVDVLADEALRGLHGLVTGANELDTHLRGVEPGRDFEPQQWADVRRVEAGDTDPTGAEIRIEPAIEVGNIFKLGTRYSEPLGARYLDEQGAEQPIVMGSYGIGPARIVAAAIEQFHDEQGIAWPRALAPFDIELITLGKEGEEARQVADGLYDDLRGAGFDVLYEDRDRSPGEKFADAELLGCPLRLTIGKRGLEAGEVDAQIRRGQEQRTLPLDGVVNAAAELWTSLP
jgi:prolyl-tRNA synthetase